MKILTILGARPQFIKAGLRSFNIKMPEGGFNTLVGAKSKKILSTYHANKFNKNFDVDLYSGGVASRNIIKELLC